MISWNQAFAANPLIAILRGLTPERAVETASVLFDAGFRIVEVPLNSPRPLESISAIAETFGDRMVVGAGTVLTADAARAVVTAGGRLIVAPNLDAEVGEAARDAGAAWCPGVVTPTEAFLALRLGAAALKVFPAEMVPPPAVAALRAVLPPEATVIVVGGITPDTMAGYRAAGAQGFGLGSALFKPDYDLDMVLGRARQFRAALKEMREP
ncbi:2-dehydro-3-deoxy-6-phosphogalactonate aldolase [Maliponia aquimaris]|uniref:2-dehydro-3-deoxy-6-phosphogalactonate aldolase n=1 Tax=Maliponia aquimaris TaxID=1673631 RepID=A0A238KYC3_9RHOB|nr:2-dehydro-3-deoxy-6-phosphogalactonate aldolase [Maliponia aquimaris]SMX47844.1 2-dehydro-3-deoxy-6-phosphogalactonate aldolase [Maliponia aquimaris]